MAWVVTKSLGRLKSDFNTTFPNKDKSSDGTIGDTAHQAETSGHNPDDTSGSKSESTDADNIAEVRAIDVDNDLHATANMQDVINRMLQTPNDLKRLTYIIYNHQIWRKKNGWKKETYNGSSPHTEHAHFSGDPAFDEDSSAWTSVTSFAQGGGIMGKAEDIIEAWSGGFAKTSDGTVVSPVEWRKRDEDWQKKIDTALATITQKVGSVNFSDTQTSQMAGIIADRLVAHQGNALTDADKTVIIALVKQALREGVA